MDKVHKHNLISKSMWFHKILCRFTTLSFIYISPAVWTLLLADRQGKINRCVFEMHLKSINIWHWLGSYRHKI